MESIGEEVTPRAIRLNFIFHLIYIMLILIFIVGPHPPLSLHLPREMPRALA